MGLDFDVDFVRFELGTGGTGDVLTGRVTFFIFVCIWIPVFINLIPTVLKRDNLMLQLLAFTVPKLLINLPHCI